MRALDWNDGLSVGVAAIDAEHQGLIAIYEALRHAMESQSEPELRINDDEGKQIFALLFALTTHAEQHFRNEERAMAEAAYPKATPHRQLHAQLLKDVADLTMRYGNDALGLSGAILVYLRSWLLDHIQTEDRAFGGWLRARAAACPPTS